MACVNPDGTLSKTAILILESLDSPLTVEEISEKTEVPLFLLRSNMRELVGAGVVKEEGERYAITEQGTEEIAK
jgi:predicted transcriptional regulator